MTMTDNIISFAIIFVGGELVAIFLFWGLNRAFTRKGSPKANVEGILERLFLFLSFTLGVQLSLVFFGTLKVATHVRSDDNKLPKMYYLIGNLSSATLAISYYGLWEHVAPLVLN